MARMMSGWKPSSWICWASEREAWPNVSHVSRSRSCVTRSTLVEADVLRPHWYPVQILAGGLADGGHDGRGHRDARRLTHPLGAERGLRIGLFDEGGQHVGRVEAGGQE